MYIDIHTHKEQRGSADFYLQNIRFAFEELPDVEGNYSIGLHPWDIATYVGNNLSVDLTKAVKQSKAIAIGEIGLDKNCSVDFLLQQQLFQQQLQVANNLRLPIVLHCVKAYYEMVALLKNRDIQTACIVHGFNKNVQIATLLLEADCYLSFGKALLNNNTLQQVFQKVPLTRLFLETDDADIDIQTVYEQAADLKHTSVEQLQNQLADNFNRCFNE